MKIKNFNLFFGIGIILVLSLYFVLATIGAPVAWAEGNVTALYDEGVFTINWTAGAGDAAANYTLHLWMNDNFINSTDNVNTSTTGYAWANTTEANYTFSFSALNASDAVTGVNSSNVSIYVDSTASAVSSPISPVINGNYSDSALLVLNVSIVDAGGATLVWFNITNGTGVSNGTAIASNGAGNFWNATLNTSLYPDGTYNVTVYANDTVNNLNSSVYTGNFTIDNTNPVATFTCNPSTLGPGADTVCTCTGTDAGSGVNTLLTTAAVTITANSTYGAVTTGTSNCTITDYAGNTHNATGTYTVASDSATDGTSSTTSLTPPKWTGTFAINENQFNNGYTNQLEFKKRIRFKVKNMEHHMGILELTETTAKIEVSSIPQEATLSIGDTRKFDVSEDGYYDVIVTLNSISESKADITIKSINELITEEAEAIEQKKESSAETVAEEEVVEGNSSIFGKWWFWLIVVLVIIGIGYNFQKNKE